MEEEKKKNKQMRMFLLFILVLILVNFVFNLNLPHYVWIILFFILCLLSIIQVIDKKLRLLDDRIVKLEEKNK